MPGPLLSDLDGTIADTAPAIFESLHLTCAAFGVELDPDIDLTFCLGPPLHWCLTELGIDEERLPDAIAVFETAHTERMSLVVAMPGVEAVFAELRRAGVQIGVATIKPQYAAELVLDTLGLRQYVDVVAGRSDDMDPRTKTELLSVAAAQVPGPSPLYVGDHGNDELAAKQLGIPFLWYPQNSWEQVRDAVLNGRR